MFEPPVTEIDMPTLDAPAQTGFADNMIDATDSEGYTATATLLNAVFPHAPSART